MTNRVVKLACAAALIGFMCSACSSHNVVLGESKGCEYLEIKNKCVDLERVMVGKWNSKLEQVSSDNNRIAVITNQYVFYEYGKFKVNSHNEIINVSNGALLASFKIYEKGLWNIDKKTIRLMTAESDLNEFSSNDESINEDNLRSAIKDGLPGRHVENIVYYNINKIGFSLDSEEVEILVREEIN